MAKTKLTKDMRSRTLHRLIRSVADPREEELRRREHELTREVIRHRFGEDVFDRCRAMPEGWMESFKAISIGYNLHQHLPHRMTSYGGRYQPPPCRYGWSHFGKLELDEFHPLPTCIRQSWGLEDFGDRWDDVVRYFTDWHDLHVELEKLDAMVTGTLSGFTYVDDLAQHWPEGYVHFPQEVLVPGTANLPAVPLDDLNARIEALREGKVYA